MYNRLQQYENQLTLAAKAIEEYVPGVGEIDPIEVGHAVHTYMKAFDSIIKMEQTRGTLNRRNHD